ncbi:MAG TPA: hypothetical protein VF186_08495 [Gaiellaceae bacterium]
MKTALATAALLGAVALLAAGCSGGAKQAEAAPAAPAKPKCAHPAGWQKLANRIGAPVYCPGWLPDPLVAQIGGRWNNIDSVSKDRSYLESFVWQDVDLGGTSGELHVNLRGYPGRTTIPTCRTGGGDSQNVPCFADPHGTVRANGLDATLYTVNQDADQWHLLLAWHAHGGLYTVSEHLAPPLTYKHLVRYLKHELRSLVLVRPSAT